MNFRSIKAYQIVPQGTSSSDIDRDYSISEFHSYNSIGIFGINGKLVHPASASTNRSYPQSNLMTELAKPTNLARWAILASIELESFD